MQLSEIIYHVCDSVGLPRPNTVAGSNQQLARQMLSLLNTVVREIRSKPWRELEVESSFNTVAGTQAYALPANFLRLAANTVISSGDMRVLRGSNTPAQWSSLLNTNFPKFAKYYIRTDNRAQEIRLTPTPDEAQEMSFIYYTKHPIIDETGEFKEVFTADTDTSLFPDAVLCAGLKWRIKHAKGLEYGEDFNEWLLCLNTELSQSLSSMDIPVAGLDTSDMPFADPYMPENGFGS